jgi:hypothetical protein
MKKVLFVLVLFMAVLAVNAQATQTPQAPQNVVTKEKPLHAVIMVTDLQKAITDNIAKDYVGYTIKEATSVTDKNVVTYEVIIVKGTAIETLVYDNDGAFVKKLPTTPAPEIK